MKIGGIERTSIVDGPGIRTVIYFSGCKHNCPQCHAGDLKSPTFGEDLTKEELLEYIKEDDKFIDGITLSGGDPTEQMDDVVDFCRYFMQHYNDKTIMLYTGGRFEHIESKYLYIFDYIMDGEYRFEKPTTKNWRGSDNQRFFNRIGAEWHQID